MNNDVRRELAGYGDEDPHEWVSTHLPDFALGDLDALATGRAERHLQACDRCRSELAGIQEALTLLAFAAPPAQPAAATRAALFQRLPRDGEHVAQPARGPDTATNNRRLDDGRSTAIWRIVSALAAVMAAALLGSTLWLWRDLEAERTAMATMSAQLASQSELARLLENPETPRPLLTASSPERMAGYVYVRPDSSMALLVALGLPPLPANARYQLWLVRMDGTRDSGGMFSVDSDGNGQLIVRAPGRFADYKAVGITVEPWSGSSGPTTPRVAGATVQ